MMVEMFKVLDLDVSIIDEIDDDSLMSMVGHSMEKAHLKFLTYITE